MSLRQHSRNRTVTRTLLRFLQNPASVAAVSDRRPSLPAISAVGDRRYRVLQEALLSALFCCRPTARTGVSALQTKSSSQKCRMLRWNTLNPAVVNSLVGRDRRARRFACNELDGPAVLWVERVLRTRCLLVGRGVPPSRNVVQDANAAARQGRLALPVEEDSVQRTQLQLSFPSSRLPCSSGMPCQRTQLQP